MVFREAPWICSIKCIFCRHLFKSTLNLQNHINLVCVNKHGTVHFDFHFLCYCKFIHICFHSRLQLYTTFSNSTHGEQAFQLLFLSLLKDFVDVVFISRNSWSLSASFNALSVFWSFVIFNVQCSDILSSAAYVIFSFQFYYWKLTFSAVNSGFSTTLEVF